MRTSLKFRTLIILLFAIPTATPVKAGPLLIVASESAFKAAHLSDPGLKSRVQSWKEKRIKKLVERKLKRRSNQKNTAKNQERTIPQLAKISLIMSLLSIGNLVLAPTPFIGVIFFTLSLLAGLTGIVTGFISLFQIIIKPKKYKGADKAIKGIFLGLIPFILVGLISIALSSLSFVF